MDSVSALQNVQSAWIGQAAEPQQVNGDSTFDSIFATAMNMINETNDLQNEAESLEVQFLLGDADNAHDLQIAQQKATSALSYTIAVRDQVLEAYNSIMNMQM